MKTGLERKPWGLVMAFLVGGGLVILAIALAQKGVSQKTIGEILDRIYIFGRQHVWEFSAIASLSAGIWFSMAQRRIVLSVICLIMAFLFSFVLPNF